MDDVIMDFGKMEVYKDSDHLQILKIELKMVCGKMVKEFNG